MYSFCTLFDSKYLDKGIALYNSLSNNTDDFRLYIFAFDNVAYDILIDMKLANAVIISLKDFETEQMKKLKLERSAAEYCWTCTPISIEYVLEKYNVDMCTYLDADLYFFASPKILLDEIDKNDKSVIITEHRFDNTIKGIEATKKNGKYCVQFNTFKNNEEGIKVLKWWKEKCIEWCYFKHEENRMGDQKYLDEWTKIFDGVHELQHLGGGVAPWNLAQYELSSAKDKKIEIIHIKSKQIYTLVFYHFQNIRYLPFRYINIKAGKVEAKLKNAIYLPYLKEVESIRKMLFKRYRLNFDTRKSCSNNPIVSFIQQYIMQFKIRDLSDIVNLDRI